MSEEPLRIYKGWMYDNGRNGFLSSIRVKPEHSIACVEEFNLNTEGYSLKRVVIIPEEEWGKMGFNV